MISKAETFAITTPDVQEPMNAGYRTSQATAGNNQQIYFSQQSHHQI